MRLLKGVALFEAFKGTLALLAALGVLSLIPRDARHLALELAARLHLNPGKNYPGVFVRLIEDMGSMELWLIAALVLTYAAVRFLEAYGLWRSRPWAEWLAAVSGGIYVPFELYELSRGFSWIKLAALILNVLVVAYMCYVLWRTRPRPAPDRA